MPRVLVSPVAATTRTLTPQNATETFHAMPSSCTFKYETVSKRIPPREGWRCPEHPHRSRRIRTGLPIGRRRVRHVSAARVSRYFSVLGVLIPLPLAFFFGLVTVRHTLSLHWLLASAARCMWGFFGLFLLTWLLEGLLIGEAPGPFMYVCVGTLILSATIAHLLTLGARAAKSS